MRIKTRLSLSFAISLCLMVFLTLVLMFFSYESTKELENGKKAGELVSQTTDLILIGEEYLVYQYPRTFRQWNVKYNSLKELLNKVEDSEIIKTMQINLDILNELFLKLNIIYFESGKGQRKNVPEELALIKNELSGQMRILSHDMIESALKLSKDAISKANAIQKKSYTVTIAFLLLIISITAIASFRTIKRITEPLTTLVKDANKIRKGNLKHKIHGINDPLNTTRDEISELSLSFSSMTSKLFESIKNLEIEVSERIKAENKLQKAYDGLDHEKKKKIIELHNELQERKQMEEKLRFSERRATTCLDASPVCTKIVDLDFNLQYMSSACVRGFNIDDISQFYGKPYPFEFYPESFCNLMTMNLKKVKRTGKTIEQEGCVNDINGNELMLHSTLVPVNGDNGQIDYILVVSEDITNRRNSEVTLRRLATVVLLSNDAITVQDTKGNIIDWNKGAQKMFGYSEAEALSMNISDIVPDDKKKEALAFVQKLREEGGVKSFETQRITKNGRVLDVWLTVTKLVDDQGKVTEIATTERDITEQRLAEANLRQARKMESLGTLTGGIAHDFNNLLFMISGNTELALDDTPNWNPVYQNLQEIKSASLKAAGIVKHLLHFSRKSEQKLESISAVTVIKDSINFLKSTIPSTIKLKTQFPKTEIPILADPIQINQILMNICINASHAMEETGGTLEISMKTLSLDKEAVNCSPDLTFAGKYLEIKLRDTGPGIPPEITNRIFDPYFTTKDFGKGSGMGLTVVHGIVKNHDGAITVSTKVGEGTTFTILFPVIDEAPEITIKKTVTIPHGTETILFVDDEKAITNMMRQVLEKLGYHVEAKLNPEKALELFKSKPDSFDIVITDMTMPQMTGAKFAEKLKEIRPDIPVILCTGHSSIIDGNKAKQSGISDYLMKPVSKSKIAKAIRVALDK